ncbi:MAG: spondin domain-containing protein [Verrucomicrobiota bacterium]
MSSIFPQDKRDVTFPVTLVSMIAPSPDWFVGVDGLSLIADGQWATNKVVTLYGKDAGTDSGASYSSPDQVTVPRGVVTQFAGFPALVNGVIVPFGTFTFTRQD